MRHTDRSMAENILYGHPDGSGGLRPWRIEEIVDAYGVGYRWARVIVLARGAFIDPADDHRYGKRTRKATEYADFIRRVQSSTHPEAVATSDEVSNV